MSIVLVVRVLFAVFLFAAVHEYAPLLVVRATDNKANPCFLFHHENAFMCHGEQVDLLDAVASVYIHVAEDDAATCAADDACGVLFADISDNFILEDAPQQYEEREQRDEGPEDLRQGECLEDVLAGGKRYDDEGDSADHHEYAGAEREGDPLEGLEDFRGVAFGVAQKILDEVE